MCCIIRSAMRKVTINDTDETFGPKETTILKRGKGWNPFLLVIVSFIVVIVVGTILLAMPFSLKSGVPYPKDAPSWFSHLLDCFFVATSATCVTGLNTFKDGLAGTFNMFGQIVVLLMIQVGGLGFITVLSFFLTLFSRHVEFKNRLFLAQATGSTSFGKVVYFVRKIIIISFSMQIIGAIAVFPAYYQIAAVHSSTVAETVKNAIWPAFFHSASAFNNAGFDILGSASLLRDSEALKDIPNWAYNYLLIVTMILIIIGGISFLVILDVLSFKRFRQYKVFTKIVLLTTGVLLVLGTLLFALFECTKPTNPMNFLDALFQSVTCRTAGFASYDQTQLSIGGRIVSCLLMFVGGSPLSTAGGIKTTTIFMVGLALVSYVSGREVSAFKRTYSSRMVLKAMSVVTIAIIVVITAYGAISAIEFDNPSIDDQNRAGFLFFESFSAFGTVGLSADITPKLRWGSKLIIIVLMFLGRLGPMTMFQVFQSNMDKKSKLHYSYVEEDFLIG